MLVAQKKYSYNELYEYDQRQRQQAKVREVVVTRRGAVRKIKAIFAVVLFLSLGLFILLRYAQINEHNQKLSKLKTELNKIGKVNSQLQIQLDRKVDLSEIEKAAVEKLSMQYPNKNQIVYLQLEKKDFTEIPEEVKNKQNAEIGVFQTAAQGISELVKYLY